MFLFFVKNVKHYSKQISFSHLQGYKHATSKIKNNYALKSTLVYKNILIFLSNFDGFTAASKY